MIKNYTLTLLLFFCAFVSFGQTTIAIQDFEAIPSTPTLNFSFNSGTFTSVSGNSAGGDRPQNSPQYSSADTSWRIRNTYVDADFGPVDISSYQSVQVEFNLAAFSIGSTGNGVDGGDYVDVYISLDNGATWSYELEITGDNNARWAFSSGSNRTITYDGDDIPESFSSSNSNSINNIIINIPDGDAASASNFLVGFVVSNNSSNESWNIDDIKVSGISSSPCTVPASQPTNLVLNNITGTSIDGNFTATTSDDYLVVVSTSAILGADPVNGVSYTNGESIGSGTVIQSSSGTNFTATGLSQTTQYYFFVFSVNASGCSGGPLYNIIGPLSGNATTISGPCLSTSFENSEGWSDHAYGNWTETDSNGDVWVGNGIFAGNAGNRRIQMNDVNDWLELPPVHNPASLEYYGGLSSSATGNNRIMVQYFNGTTWVDIVEHTATLATYQLFTADLSSITALTNVRLRLFRTAHNRVHYIDDISVYCGPSTPIAELQLVDAGLTNQNCGYTIDFGSVANDGSTSDATFNINNIGSVDLTISSFNITGDYTIVSPATPFTINSGNSQIVTVRFTPSAAGIRTGILTINNNDLDESACAINLTGTGFTPTPEIDIERNTGGSIPDGSGASTGFNTVFAATVVGNSTAPKTFYVSSEGTANLNLISISSSNPAEFSISLNPGAVSISPGTEVNFEITFSPTGVGLRTATITIISNDSDESPYTFTVRGNGECASGTLTFLPDNGPVGTIVSISSSSNNFGGSTTATVSGIPTSINIISNSEIELTIPPGASTGSISINDDLGCSNAELFTVINQQISSCQGDTGVTPTDLFISEVTDHGTGSHSYIELFNGTGTVIDLTDYEIRIHNNGATVATNTIPLTGSVVNNDVFIIAFGSTDATNPYSAHGYDLVNSSSGINEDDHIRLYNVSTNTWVDLWGDTSGNVFTIASKDYTYRRKNSGITAPSTIWNANDWDSFVPVDYSDIGTFDFSTGIPPTVNSITDLTTTCNETTITVNASEGFIGGNTLRYSWYFYNPAQSGLGWQAISNGGIYTTVNTSPSLIISDASSVLDYQFYCEVREDDASCYSASAAIQITISSATWDGTNWDWNDGTLQNTLPTSATTVILTGDYDTFNQGSFSACNLIVDNVLLNIANGDFVQVENNLVVNGTDGFINVENEGAFVQVNDAGTVTADLPANITVNKQTAPSNNWYEYTYWSSPVFEETPDNGLAASNPNRRYEYNAANFRDSFYETGNDGVLTGGAGIDDIDDGAPYDWQAISTPYLIPGVGYAATHSPGIFASTPGCPGLTCRIAYVFSGLFNNGVVTVPLFKNDSEPGDTNWNFVGNPYPSAISADAFLTTNVGIIEGAIYLWSQNTAPSDTTNGNENLNFSQSDYAIINGTGETAGGDLVSPTRFIPSGQGFFVAMENTATSTIVSPSPVPGDLIRSADITFNNTMRVTGNNNQFFRSATETALDNKLWLNLTTDNGAFSQVLIGYIETATDGYDGLYFDAPRNASTDFNAIIYTSIPEVDKKFAIQGKNTNSLTLDETIPLGFLTAIDVPTLYTIAIAQTEGDFMSTNTIYLRDALMNITHNLSDSAYNFTAATGDFNNRFEILFTPDALSVKDEQSSANDLFISELANGDVVFSVGPAFSMRSISILDVLGRTIYQLEASSSRAVYSLPQLSKAPYIAKVTLTNGQVLSKKAIKQQ